MRKIRKQALAEADLIEIWIYSYEQWGEAQAERYLDELENGINQLAAHPELGRRCDHIRQGYRAIQINRHIVYFKVTPSAIQVIRVLHARMDPGSRLADS